ncbi:MAG: lysylphosphatidylglycerol synthase domain-containing protein, partial [Thermodesulfobacteriota bacterium]
MNRGLLYFGLSILISLALGGFLLSQIDIHALVRTFKNLHFPSLSLYVSLAILGIISRTYRYYLLISSGTTIRFGYLILVTMVRNLFVDLLPAKIGSLSYVYLINRRLGAPFEVAASSFLLAFVFDLVVLFPIFFAAVAITGTETIHLLSVPFILFCILLFLTVLLG